MPEGPEIRLAADRVAEVILGEEIVDAKLGLPQLQQFEAQLTGRRVTAVDTRGKAMLTRFDNGLTIYSHNQLYGRWFTTVRPHMPRTSRQLRVALHTKTHSALLYSASDIEVLNDQELASHPFLSRIGPDILDPNLTARQIVERLDADSFRNRALGGLFLDQAFLAGVGNYLRSEILWAAGVAPSSRPDDLDGDQLLSIARQTLEIAQRSYRTRGVTAPEEEAAQRKLRGLSFEQYRFQVFGRGGEDCYRCGSTIERRSMASRSVYVCHACQPS